MIEKMGFEKLGLSIAKLRSNIDSKWLIAFGLLLLLALIYWTQTIIAVKNNHIAIPVWDYWRTAMNLDQYRNFEFRWVFQQHNEHRIVFPETVFAADYLLFDGREVFPLILNALFHFATAILFGWTILMDSKMPRNVGIAGALLSTAILGWPGLTYLLSSPFLLQWTMFELFTALALVAISLSSNPKRRELWLAAAIACGTVATFSSANGLVLWPVLLAAAVWVGLPRRLLAVLSVTGIFLIGLFLNGYVKSSTTHPEMVIAHFGYWLKFIGCYMGLPFSLIDNSLGIILGWVGIALFGCCLWRLRSDDVRGNPVFVLYVGFGFITLATVVMTSFARMDVADATLAAAKAPRYLLLPLLYWTGLLLTGLWLICRSNPPLWRPVAVLSIAGALAVIALPLSVSALNTFLNEYRQNQLMAIGIEAGLEDKELIERSIYPVFYWPHQLLPSLREKKLSVFSDPLFLWLNRDFQATSIKKESQVVTGKISVQAKLSGGVEIVGLVADTCGCTEFLFVNEIGKVVGLGARLSAGLPDDLKVGVPLGMQAWVGFVNQSSRSYKVRAWAFGSDHTKLSPVGEEIGLPQPATLYKIENANSGKVLDVLNQSTSNGAQIQQYDYVGGDNQLWMTVPINGIYTQIVNKNSGRVLDVRGLSKASGALLQQWDYLGGDNQQWQLLPLPDGAYEIVNKNSGKALEVQSQSKTNGGFIDQGDYNGAANQQWKLVVVQ